MSVTPLINGKNREIVFSNNGIIFVFEYVKKISPKVGIPDIQNYFHVRTLLVYLKIHLLHPFCFLSITNTSSVEGSSKKLSCYNICRLKIHILSGMWRV